MRSQQHRENGTTRALATLVASRYWRARDAEQVLAAWRRSGQSAATFARQQGLNHSRLLRWRERLGPSAPVFHPVRVVKRVGTIATPAPAPLELELKGGRRIRVPAGFDPEQLEALVRTVESWGC